MTFRSNTDTREWTVDTLCAECGERCGQHCGYECPKPHLEHFKSLNQVGDINSNAKGSGARYNAGKVDIGLIPFSLLPVINNMATKYHDIFECLGFFQMQNGSSTQLIAALQALPFSWQDCAKVFEYGAKKYARFNWQKGQAWSVPLACAGRHLMAMIDGQELDPESNLPHSGHVAANLVMLLWFYDHYPEGDDRFKGVTDVQ